jgi:MFS family permease
MEEVSVQKTIPLESQTALDQRTLGMAILVYLAGLGPSAFQIFLPSIANLQASLHAEGAMTNLTLSASMISFSVATLFHGMLADMFGRLSP